MIRKSFISLFIVFFNGVLFTYFQVCNSDSSVFNLLANGSFCTGHMSKVSTSNVPREKQPFQLSTGCPPLESQKLQQNWQPSQAVYLSLQHSLHTITKIKDFVPPKNQSDASRAQKVWRGSESMCRCVFGWRERELAFSISWQ